VERRRQREQQGRRHAERGGEGQRACIHHGGQGPRDLERGVAGEQVQPRVGEQRPQPGGQRGQDQALAEQLARDAPAGRAHGEAYRHLAPPPVGAGQQQARDVGAGDEQQEPHGRREQRHRGAVGTDHVVLDRHREAPERHLARVVVRTLAAQLDRRGGELLLEPRQRGARREASRRGVAVAAGLVQLFRIRGAGQPDAGGVGGVLGEVRRQREARGHHAHDLVGNAVDGDAAAEHAGVPAVAPLPQLVGQDHELQPVRHVLLGPEHSTEQGPHAQDLEGVPRDPSRRHAHGLPVSRQVAELEAR
jgi:hypothetical protein